jgi:hypothetical protein
MFHKIKTFITLPGKRLLTEAWVTQLYVGLVLKIVPFKKIPVLFPNPEMRRAESGERRAKRVTPGTQNTKQQLEDLRSAVLLASRYTLWRNKCLVQSLAARRMLARRGISSQLSLGLRRNDHNKTEAHAWLKVGDDEIVSKNGDYLELYSF